ncbi:AAEL007834-PA [Aedes aegypti]|uniref:AAEL007834-PA n=1 Tax=Aedes aegypti TaxID=7159 RepID=Q170Q6_AEDAE|nr:AAEL007834-PA [Aedes aegypti]
MKQLILLLVVAVALVDYSQAQGNRKCAANGEYCLTHSECCSGSCLSFSYKCVPVPPSASVGTVFVPAPIETDNRFGGGDDSGTSITQKTCAKNGEYCLTAADCCSRSCLSFSYKCVQNYDLGTQQLTSSGIPVQLPVGGSSINTIDTANRFGGGGSERQCLANGHACFYGQECCSGACFRSFCATQIHLGIPESALTRPSAVNGPFVQVNSLDELITRFGGGSDANHARDSSASASLKRANIGARSGVEKQCAVVGEGCSRQEDCCSMRCHSYRRKCVT